MKGTEQPRLDPHSIHQLDGVDLLATIKGELFFKDERVKFRGLLKISPSHRMRLEIFNPFGKIVSVTIFSKSSISLFIPSMNVLYRGTASSRNMLKLFGLEIEPNSIINLLMGVEPFHSIQDRGFFSTILMKDGLSWRTIASHDELWNLIEKGGTLALKDPDAVGTLKAQVLFHYLPDPKQQYCPIIIPKENDITMKDSLLRLKIRVEEIRSYMLYADGGLSCGFADERVAWDKEEMFSDLDYEEKPGVDLLDLDQIEVDQPLFFGE